MASRAISSARRPFSRQCMSASWQVFWGDHPRPCAPTRENNYLLTPKQLSVLRKQFDELDEDNSGYIDGEELQNLAAVLGEDLSPEELEEAVKRLDTNGDGPRNLVTAPPCTLARTCADAPGARHSPARTRRPDLLRGVCGLVARG